MCTMSYRQHGFCVNQTIALHQYNCDEGDEVGIELMENSSHV